MKINTIIKRQRLEQNLTQEQLATYLGVSAPAVNKWEKGLSYPDITLLSPLARILKVDVNTLLSFHEELTDKEITEFLNQAVTSIPAEGYEHVFEICMEKIKTYPTCGKLMLNVAMILHGSLFMYNVTEDREFFLKEIESLYQRCAASDDLEVKYQALSMLINQYIGQGEYEEAQKSIDILPNTTYDKKQLQGTLFISKGEMHQASELFEGKLLHSTTEVYTTLISMMEIALKENRKEDARYIAGVIEKANLVFELWSYNTNAAYLQLYSSLKEEEGVIDTLEKMLPLIDKKWEISKTRLYRHIKKKGTKGGERVDFLEAFVDMLKNDGDGSLDFVKENPRFQALLEKY